MNWLKPIIPFNYSVPVAMALLYTYALNVCTFIYFIVNFILWSTITPTDIRLAIVNIAIYASIHYCVHKFATKDLK